MSRPVSRTVWKNGTSPRAVARLSSKLEIGRCAAIRRGCVLSAYKICARHFNSFRSDPEQGLTERERAQFSFACDYCNSSLLSVARGSEKTVKIRFWQLLQQ